MGYLGYEEVSTASNQLGTPESLIIENSFRREKKKSLIEKNCSKNTRHLVQTELDPSTQSTFSGDAIEQLMITMEGSLERSWPSE